jgi:2-polyprenyl-3-methyl-5-hydroxy-6-metoxy-1,4-benzoquinol methylase
MPTAADAAQLRAEFDEIASLSPRDPMGGAAEVWIAANLPARHETVLDIGCGVGDLARSLAAHFAATHAIDLSPGMIDEARNRTSSERAITFACADMFEWLESRLETYDCIVSVATLHHVDLSSALRAMAQSLKPGGRLLIVDLYDRSGPRHLLTNLAAAAVNAAQELVALLQRRSSWRLRQAYRSHGANETYLPLSDVEAIARVILPGARITGTLLWRYRLLWEKA